MGFSLEFRSCISVEGRLSGEDCGRFLAQFGFGTMLFRIFHAAWIFFQPHGWLSFFGVVQPLLEMCYVTRKMLLFWGFYRSCAEVSALSGSITE